MNQVINLTGRVFGRLTVRNRSGSNKTGQAIWECECECGTYTIKRGSLLRNGSTKSCGCLSSETTGDRSRKHGLSRHPLYSAWKAMNLRCSNPDHPSYADYGGRGITVCAEWQADFLVFYGWAMAHGWSEGLEIDRQNNDGPYSPGNCRFTTRREQLRNTRVNHLIETPLGTMTIVEAAERAGVSNNCIVRRIKSSWPTEHLFAPPSTGGRRPF